VSPTGVLDLSIILIYNNVVKQRGHIIGAFFFLVLPFFLRAEIITGPLGFAPDIPGAFYFDVPPGFEKTGASPDGLGASFVSTILPVQFILRLNPDATLARDTQGVLSTQLTRLNASFDISTFRWYGQSCAVASFTFDPPGDPRRAAGSAARAEGWGIAVELPAQAGVITALAYADSQTFALDEDAVNSMLLSVLDSLVVSKETRYSPGPVTTFAWPKTTVRKQNVKIGERIIAVTLDDDDVNAAQSVIEREYTVLLLYQNAPILYKNAWQRYYQQIFRDSGGRVRPAAEAILNALDADEEGALRTLLAWMQNQPYARSGFRSDFTSLPGLLVGDASDCDSRAMLVAAILHQMGSKTALFVSEEFAHAWLGIQTDLPGARKDIPQVGEYLLCETVHPLNPGTVAKELYEGKDWFPVILSY
jgi:hypothetical protein